ncbi:DinB family protein [Pedobacter rhizosphaerae]|uniref:DinB superfamily protein n=1 Tax=Pedobacter rhizosphaerae TaxID=390241 RepID=A0A1H9QX06_9SPHI|nr:DinB family protein [Pedobacter rhizosphaerae]SER65014.1 DinB superfamily protein [Pedobacter rhizosphaerae]
MENLIKEMQESLSTFESTFLSCPEESINKVPFSGSWTVGQLVQHMTMSNDGFADLFSGSTTETNRPADLMAEKIKNILEDFNYKMDAPEFLYPAFKDYSHEELKTALGSVESKLVNMVGKLDWTKTCTAFELPVLGNLTRLEAAYFIIYHTKRHTKQLANIVQQLKQTNIGTA